ncbi:hypothetical protein H0H92_006535 [Tricholoma furcatifolium]|nr:hypothetical protein H0H92_006535 [Tricholoma furcatifolium]
MSTSTLLSHDEEMQRSPSNIPITRTVAIIKTHALPHRFEIERRIQEAGFEIMKERQMEFDTETDPETLYELFGEDAASFSEGPVWVYVLERRRAVEVWTTLMGNADPDAARIDAPNSLRALFGKSLVQNALMGSPDAPAAELQIASIFASSPPFPTTDLPSDPDAEFHGPADEGYAASSATNQSTPSRNRLSVSGQSPFRARPVPATNATPDIVPRTTRAAALRAGIAVEKTPSSPRTPLSQERLKQTFENVPGHKRSETIAVASTAAPVIAPRMTRAASLRIGVTPPTPVRRRASEGGPATFEGVPGHKRRESIAVASTKAPTVAPRLNKSAALRQQKDQAPPTSFMFRGATTPKTPGAISRTTSMSSLGSSTKSSVSAAPSTAPAPAPAPTPKPARPAAPVKRPSSVAGSRPSLAPRPPSALKANGAVDADQSKPARPPRPSSVASLNHAPSIQPRTNRSAALRAAKMEAENLAAAAAAAKKKPRPSKPAPSSFKPIAV